MARSAPAHSCKNPATCTIHGGQRQDSLFEQVRDLVLLANREGMYDAADWISDRWNERAREGTRRIGGR